MIYSNFKYIISMNPKFMVKNILWSLLIKQLKYGSSSSTGSSKLPKLFIQHFVLLKYSWEYELFIFGISNQTIAYCIKTTVNAVLTLDYSLCAINICYPLKYKLYYLISLWIFIEISFQELFHLQSKIRKSFPSRKIKKVGA